MEYKFKVSTEKKNSKNIIIETSGIKLDEFLSNPIALHNHDSNQLIGVWKDTEIDEDDNSLVSTLVPDDSDELSIAIGKKIKKGILKHASIAVKFNDGYIYDVPDSADSVLVVTECTLKEISVTPLPANTDAVKLYYKDKEIEQENDFLKLGFDNEIKIKEIMSNKKENKENKGSEETLNFKEKFENLQEEYITLKNSYEEASNKLAEIERKEEELKFNELLNKAVEDNKIKEENKEVFLSLSYETAEKILYALEKRVKKDVNEVKLSDKLETEEKTKSHNKDYGWYEKNDPEALKLMYEENRELHDSLFKEYYGVDPV